MFVWLHSQFFVAVFAPLWLLVCSAWLKHDSTSIRYVQVVTWISVSIATFFLGVALRKRTEAGAECFLNWVTKPLLLLCAILYITLGIYTNTYLFSIFDGVSLGVFLLFSCVAYVVVFVVAKLSRLEFAQCKTLATHAAFPHCLLAIVVARYSLVAPASDVVSIAPITLLVFAHIPFLLEFIFKSVRAAVLERLQATQEDSKTTSGTESLTPRASLDSQQPQPQQDLNDRKALVPIPPSNSYQSCAVHEKITSL